MPRDPVCGMNVREQSDSNLRSEFNGKTYHFCSDRCRQEFDRNPSNYAKEDDRDSLNDDGNRNNRLSSNRNPNRNDSRVK